MLKVDVDNNVFLTRGDTCELVCTITDDVGTEYVLQTGDVLTFTIKINCNTSDIIIQKELTSNIISLEPSDTSDLDYGSYWFDVQLTKAGGDIFTVIPPRRFNITPEVTFEGVTP